jgi:putative sterol carrier protein
MPSAPRFYDACVPSFLSDEWIDALDAAASSAPALAGVLADGTDVDELVIEHVVDDEGTERAFHLVLGHGPARAHRGRADEPTITFAQDRATASAIASGAASAQSAFMSGKLRLGGRVDLLLEHHGALAELDDVFAAVRAQTQW